MTPEGHNDLLPLLKQKLQTADKPLTSYDLYAMEDVKAIAPSANRVSDYLGVMYRRGELSRVNVSGISNIKRVRWAYVWRERELPDWVRQAKREPKPFRPKPVLEKPNIFISEDGSHLHIEMPEISIKIEISKNK